MSVSVNQFAIYLVAAYTRIDWARGLKHTGKDVFYVFLERIRAFGRLVEGCFTAVGQWTWALSASFFIVDWTQADDGLR